MHMLTHVYSLTHTYSHTHAHTHTRTVVSMFQTGDVFANSLVMQPAISASLERSLLGWGGRWVIYQSLPCSLPHCVKKMSLMTKRKVLAEF